MPFVDYGDTAPPNGLAPSIDITPALGGVSDPGILTTVGAAFRQSNTIASGLSDQTAGMDPLARDADPNFNPLPEIKGTKYEDRALAVAGIFNRPYFDAWKRQVDQEDKDRATIEAGGWLGTGASVIAAVLDLPSLIPGGEFLGIAKGGATAGRLAFRTAVAGGIGAAASEAGLQATQQTRTAEESAIGIGSGVILGGLLGGAVGAVMSRVEQRAAVSAVDRLRGQARSGTSLTPVADEVEAAYSRDLQSVGAAAVSRDTLDDLSVEGRAASALAKSTAKLNPILRALHSPSLEMRRLMNGIVENSVYLKKNVRGEGDAAVESLIKQWDRGALSAAMDDHVTAWKDARAAGLKMSREEFSRAVGQAARRGDTGDNEFVTRAAKAWRNRVVEPLKKEAQETGQLPKDLPESSSESYFHRVYRRDKIRAQEREFKEAIRPHIERSIDNAMKAEVGKVDKRLTNLRSEADTLETGILRRQEEFQRREQGGEAVLDDNVSEDDVVSMIRQLRAEVRPKEPESLTSFSRKLGLYDEGGDLSAVGISNKTAPGLLRKARRSMSAKGDGGLGLDDAASLAWQNGFFPDHVERPTVREFIDALAEDFNKTRRVVRSEDAGIADTLDRISEVETALARMGVDIKAPRLATSEDMKNLASKVHEVLNELDRQRIASLKEKTSSLGIDKSRLAEPFVSADDRNSYVNDILTDVVNKVTGAEANDVPYGLVSVQQGPLKERTLHVPDRVIEPWLEDDVELVNRRYARKMAADVEMSRYSQKQGYSGRADLSDMVDAIKADYERLKEGVVDEKTMAGLNKRRDADIKDLKAMRDLLRGNYQPESNSTNFARIARAAGTFNFIRSMGGVLVASLTDAVRPAMVHGLSAYMRDGIGPLVSNLKAYRLSAKEAKLAGTISDRILQSRMATLAELTDPYSSNSPFERFLDNAANKFSTLTGLGHWNDFHRTLASVMTQNRVLKNVGQDFASMPKRELAYMGYLGVNEDVAQRIAAQFAEHGETIDGVRVANTEEWADPVARRAYFAAINKDVDSIITVKSVGDVPLFAHSPIGRAAIQFKSFALASNQRVLMRGLQEGPGRAMGGVVGMSTVGMFIYWLKQVEAGRDYSNNPGTWVAEGLDRSGIFAVGFEINNAIEKAGGPGVYSLLSKSGQVAFPGSDARQPASRYATRGIAEGFLGPTFGLANDAISLASIPLKAATRVAGMRKQDEATITPADIATIRRLAPYASLPQWRWLIDGGLKGLGWQEATEFKGVVPELKEAVQ